MLFNNFCSHWIKEIWCICLENGNIELVKFIKSQSVLDYEKKIGWRATAQELLSFLGLELLQV
jgi:hypothetical protein